MTEQEVCLALDKWEEYRSHITEPTNDIERARLHYEGAMIWASCGFVLQKFESALAFPIGLLLASRKNNETLQKKVDAVVTCSKKDFLLDSETLPEKLKQQYPAFERVSEKKDLFRTLMNIHLDVDGRNLVKQVFKAYPGKPYFYMSVLLHLAQLNNLILKYQPKAIITTQTEQDFTSAVATHYCESKGIKYICVQHGEYGYNPSMAYMRFSEYYAWDQNTIDLLELTNLPIDYATLYTPVRYQKRYYKTENCPFFLKYYLAGNDGPEDVEKILGILLRFSQKGFKCAMRCHPRGLTTQQSLEIRCKDTGIQVENNKLCSIGESIANCEYVVAYRSTVLSEAVANKMPIIVDDLTHDIAISLRVHDVNTTRADYFLSDFMKAKLGE